MSYRNRLTINIQTIHSFNYLKSYLNRVERRVILKINPVDEFGQVDKNNIGFMTNIKGDSLCDDFENEDLIIFWENGEDGPRHQQYYLLDVITYSTPDDGVKKEELF